MHEFISLLSLCAERPKRLLVFLNPFGGKKLAKKIFQQRVVPLFSAAGIEYALEGSHTHVKFFERIRNTFMLHICP